MLSKTGPKSFYVCGGNNILILKEKRYFQRLDMVALALLDFNEIVLIWLVLN